MIESSAFKVLLNYPPNECDCAIVSIDRNGNLGELNQLVLKAYGYQNVDLNNKDLSRGYYLLRQEKKRPILFIVTVSAEVTEVSLNRNLFNGLKNNIEELRRKRVWVPLMGTGAGGLSFEKSFDIIIDSIQAFGKYADFNISIPNNKKGQEFYNNINFKLNSSWKSKNEKTTVQRKIHSSENENVFSKYEETALSYNQDDNTKQSGLFNLLNEDSKQLISILKDRTFFLAGHLWGGEDQLPRFLNDGVWENGHETNDTSAVNQAIENDIVFIKTSYAYDGISYLRIKAIGVIKENKLDGHNLDVHWNPFNNYIDIEHLGKYRRTFQAVNNYDIEAILIAILENHPNLPHIVKDLEEKGRSKDINKVKEGLDTGDQPITTIAGLLSDADSGADYLDISKDVNAFAKVMAAKSFNPPLAIALLGKWGSGKSFFMRKLKERIEHLSKINTTEQVYCNGIAHVHFNAWSYMDANLWAGVITKIFEGLQEYISNDTLATRNKKNIAKKLNQKLNIAQGEISNLEHRKNSIDKKIEALEAKKRLIEASLKQKINQIKTKSIKTVLNNLNTSFKISDKIDEALADNKSFFKSREQLDKIVPKEYWQNPINLYQKLNDKRAYFRMFFKGPGAKRNLVSLCIIILAIIGIKVALFFWVPIIGRLDFTFPDKFLYFISIIGAFIYRNYKTVKHLQPLISKFWKIKEDYELQKREALFKLGQQEKAIKFEIENYKEEIQTVNEQINKAQQSKLEIEYKLKHTQTTEALFTFIEKRSSSDDYKKHLGIVSIIRKDFEILSELFSGHREEVDNTGDSEEFKKYFKRPLERIILYIDDLDRCSDDRVVQVLEAVNLLMAYPLFIVVVGVDPRWVKNALTKKYELQFGNKNSLNNEAIEPSGYLEKIFQVPFMLKAASDDNVRHMLKTLAESQPKIRTVQEPIQYSSEEEREMNIDEVEQEPDTEAKNWEAQMPFETPIINSETIESLKFSDQEIELLQRMSNILGSNPRALKRFVNIYRVVKAHEDFKYTDASEEVEVLTVLFLIALPIGKYKNLIIPFESYLKKIQNDDLRLNDFLQNDSTAIDSAIRDSLRNSAPLLIDQKISVFQKHYPFIKRFTFTNI